MLVQDTVCNGHYVNTTINARYVVSDDEVLPAKLVVVQRSPNSWTGWRKNTAGWCIICEVCFVRVKYYQRCRFSNDTDTFALLLHYAPYLDTLGLKDIWQQYGTGEKRRMLPQRQTISQLGAPFAETVIQAHNIKCRWLHEEGGNKTWSNDM